MIWSGIKEKDIFKNGVKPGVVVHTYNTSTREADAEGLKV
jgi:hypothetical protein